jgi:uncharacterized protein YjbI with pentapeptide repeats
LDHIENGDPVICDHLAIAGDMDLSKLNLPIVHYDSPAGEAKTAAVVASKIQIRNCEFFGKIDFAQSWFKEALDLCGCTFHEEARFKGAAFSGTAAFESCRFNRYATFKYAKFDGQARFQGAVFSAIANFGNAVFHGPANFSSSRFIELFTNFSEAKFLEDTDFTGAKFSGTANFRLASFAGPASFWRSCFFADADFQGTKYEGYASFQSTTFSAGADFRGASFDEELNLEFSDFQATALFMGVHLKKASNFFRAQLQDANFKDAILGGDAQFSQTKMKKATFTGSHFLKKALFQGAGFQEEATFHGAIFTEEAQFAEATFGAKADFISADFGQESSFAHAFFQAKASFESALFQEKTTFRGAQFTTTADFSGAHFGGDLLFTNAKIQILRLLDAKISGQIDLHNADMSRLEVRWPTVRRHLIYDGAAYLFLVKNFRNMEWFEDADDCYYHYRRKSQLEKTFFIREEGRININWSKILDMMAWISCGYGVRPRYAVFLSGIFIMIFALIYWWGSGIVVEPLNGSDPSLASGEGHSLLDNFYFSAMVFTAKTQVKWYPVGIFRYLATIESVFGWLLLALFLVTLGRTMIR